MAILDFLKKKKPKEKPKEKKPKKAPKVKIEKKGKKVPKIKPKKASEIIYRVLKEPHITEKATVLARQNQYIFKVYPRTNKIEIKKAIEALYGVDVTGVRIVNIPKKRRRLGKITGFRKGYKKAIIKIKGGQKIELIPR